ncbi:nitrate reductase molybdenum cofactor assembly chaperone [Streptomyces niger]|uniref:nitrate reductase molybdenum cofactor assembly chaperone n=1 Tax=Streptomyces niger TaxID=66373 RepID=UPI000A48DB47|nr:nitrate reductase molybdenum cofactor assembly chaperone [Streptomyces niger]
MKTPRIAAALRRRTAPQGQPDAHHPDPHDHAVLRRAAGLCLDHPDRTLLDRLPLITAALDGTAASDAAADVRTFVAYLAEQDPLRAGEHYVAVFDTRNRRSLHLTWWSDGDTRRRGHSLAALKARYRAHGLHPAETELPDHLPVVLEYAAHEPADGTALLQEHRTGLELLRLALVEAGTPYALLLRAVCATLPGPSPRTEQEARALYARSPAARVPADLAGPELVGLQPYDSPGGNRWLP